MKHHIEKVPVSLRQFIKFCVVGVINTALDFGAFLLFTRLLGVFYLIANILAFSISATNSYALNRIFTFKSKQNKKLEFSLFMLVLLIGLVLAETILYISVALLGLTDIYGKIISIGIVLFWNFFGSKFLVFKVRKPWRIFGRS